MECAKTRRSAAVVCLMAAALLAGCSYQDFRRPLLRNYLADLWYSPDRPMGEPAAEVDAEALATALARWKQAYPAEQMPYTIGKRDLLRIIVHPTGGAESQVSEMPVAEDGTVSLPLIGSAQIEGLTTKEAGEKLTDLYQAGYYKNATVNVYVSLYQSREFYITGAVMKPGVETLARPRISLLEALLMAGGPSPDAGDEVVVTRVRPPEEKQAQTAAADADDPPPAGADPEGPTAAPDADGSPAAPAEAPEQESVKVSLKDLIDSSDLSRNIWIGPNDIVHVISHGPRTVLVFGYVNGPGLKALPKGERLGLLDAVGLAGGLSTHARSENSYLLRRDEGGPHRYSVDLTRIASGAEPDTILEPGDVLVVGTSWPIRALDGFLGGGSRFIPMPAVP